MFFTADWQVRSVLAIRFGGVSMAIDAWVVRIPHDSQLDRRAIVSVNLLCCRAWDDMCSTIVTNITKSIINSIIKTSSKHHQNNGRKSTKYRKSTFKDIDRTSTKRNSNNNMKWLGNLRRSPNLKYYREPQNHVIEEAAKNRGFTTLLA